MMEDRQRLVEEICSEKRGISAATLAQVLLLAVEIAREGREGRQIGTITLVVAARGSRRRLCHPGQ